ncbi:tafazzin-like [Diadema antillarum]|uniref:tafazzin-like n=1 Tax=Diadema antillarum TaxID=105358 RepID=UPI003A86990F
MPLDPGQWVLPSNPGKLWKLTSRITILATYALSRFWIRYANRCQLHNAEVLQHEVDKSRREHKPLVTVSNHTSCLDDAVLCATLKVRSFFHLKHVRWTPGASEIAFTTKRYVYYFSLGQVVPVLRGDGVYQQGMDFCLEKLNERGWTHIYSEGKVNMTKDFLRFKWGVGRLLSECLVVPTVVPMWHVGMEHVLPNYPPYIPQRNKKVTVLVGQPLDFRELVDQMKEDLTSPIEMRKKLTDLIQEEMKALRAKAEALHSSRKR